ncbi:MAG TPA: BTAD domain-containing putative transcriptional regulator [Pseudonocardiaceae bacterium]|nr:BTAD domain-containing putative transcriptional regulator [Pseudonocardiaceae bacterium]
MPVVQTVARFGILGPLEVLADGRPVALGGPQQRGLLAVLLLDANRVVSRARLVSDLWGQDPPATARSLLHGCVAGLRRVLPKSPDGLRLVTRPPGYLLRVAPGELDVDRFDELAGSIGSGRAAGSALNQPPDQDCAATLRAALALWRGPALYDLPLDACRSAATRLDERRMVVLERRVDLDLRLGRFGDLAAELAVLVRDHPLRERLWAQLMLALHGAGRQADALAAFRALRAGLVEQLGIEPSALPRQVEQSMLAGGDALSTYLREVSDPAAAPSPVPGVSAPRVPVPAQLPAAISAFTGRADDLDRLDALVADTDGAAAAIAVVVIAGAAGVGKTALAVHWAHGVRDRFADGQLYVNLRGHAPTAPMMPLEALAGFLTALGVPSDQVPVDVDLAAGLYRTMLADRRMMVVLDNARSAEQVRPLLPGNPGVMVVVTSRYGLGGLVALDGAAHVALDVLTPAEAFALLRRMLGRQVDAETEATGALARLCGFLPLALRIAAANLTLHVDQSVADQVGELAADDRLGRLTVDGDDQMAVRVAFDLSYAALPQAAARLLRLLGLVPGPDFGGDLAAALQGAGVESTARTLALLTDASLLTRPASGRYAFHDLLRLYALERVGAVESAAEREAATGRLLNWYLRGTDAAARTLYPDKQRLPIPVSPRPAFRTDAEALAWLDGERPGLVAAARLALEQPATRKTAWLLTDSLRGYFWRRMCTVEWLAIAEAGLAAARSASYQVGQAVAELCLADLHRLQGRYEVAIGHYTQAASLARTGGWDAGEGILLNSLGVAHFWLGQLPQAADFWQQRLDVATRTGHRVGAAATFGNLGLVYWLQGELDRAAEHHARALALHRDIGSRQDEAVNLANLGEAYHLLGHLDAAQDHLVQALALHREVGDRGAEAESQRILAGIWLDMGKHAGALELATQAVTLAADTGHRPVESNALNTLGAVRIRLGQHTAALADHERALQLARDTNTRYAELVALAGLAICHLRLGHLDRAVALAEHAAAGSATDGFRVVTAHALTTLLDAHLTAGNLDKALDHGRRALHLHRSTGHRHGEAGTALLLGHAFHATDDTTAAARSWRDAATLFKALGAPEIGDVEAQGRGVRCGG